MFSAVRRSAPKPFRGFPDAAGRGMGPVSGSPNLCLRRECLMRARAGEISAEREDATDPCGAGRRRSGHSGGIPDASSF